METEERSCGHTRLCLGGRETPRFVNLDIAVRLRVRYSTVPYRRYHGLSLDLKNSQSTGPCIVLENHCSCAVLSQRYGSGLHRLIDTVDSTRTSCFREQAPGSTVARIVKLFSL